MIKLSSFNTAGTFLTEADYVIGVRDDGFGGFTDWKYPASLLPQGPPGLPGRDGNNGTNGIDGTNGFDGQQGPAGPIGPAGLNWQGAFVANTIYAVDDAVGYGGASYFCINANSSILTPEKNTNDWAFLANIGAQGPQGVQGVAGTNGRNGTDGTNAWPAPPHRILSVGLHLAISVATVNNPGLGYVVGDRIIIWGVGSGTALFQVTGVDGDGGITTISLIDGGWNYGYVSGTGTQVLYPGTGYGATLDVNSLTSFTPFGGNTTHTDPFFNFPIMQINKGGVIYTLGVDYYQTFDPPYNSALTTLGSLTFNPGEKFVAFTY